MDFEDYRDVDGVKMPFVIRSSAIDTYYSQTRTVTEVRHGIPLDEKLFEMPSPPPAPRP